MVMLPPQAYPDWQGQQERYQSGPWLQEQLRKYIREGLSTPQILQKLARESFGGDTNKARQFVAQQSEVQRREGPRSQWGARGRGLRPSPASTYDPQDLFPERSIGPSAKPPSYRPGAGPGMFDDFYTAPNQFPFIGATTEGDGGFIPDPEDREPYRRPPVVPPGDTDDPQDLFPDDSVGPGNAGPHTGASIPPGASMGKDDFYDRLSETFGGRGLLFKRGLAASPYYRSVNPWARGVLESRGNPLAAMYALSGDDVGNFRSWMGKRDNPFQSGNFDFMSRLQDIQGQGFLPGRGQSWDDWGTSQGGRVNPFQSFLDDDALGQSVMREMAGRRINPALRRGYLGSLASGVSAWQDANPERSTFGEFARRGFRW